MPKLIEAMKNVNNEMAQQNKDAAGEGGKGVSEGADKGISVAEKLSFYIKYKVWEKVGPKIEGGIGKVLDKLWKILDRVVQVISKSVTTAVGSVPFVGGVLSTAISTLIDTLWGMAKSGITKALTRLCKRILDLVVGGLSKRIIEAILKKTPIVKATLEAANAAAQEASAPLQEANAHYDKQLVTANAEAKTAEKDIKSSAEEAGKEDQAEEHDMAKAEEEAAADK
jgi:hypothetical protein